VALANILIWIAGLLERMGIPYYWGFAIILFTLLIKLIHIPVESLADSRHAGQKDIQPRLQELQKKFGKTASAWHKSR